MQNLTQIGSITSLLVGSPATGSLIATGQFVAGQVATGQVATGEIATVPFETDPNAADPNASDPNAMGRIGSILGQPGLPDEFSDILAAKDPRIEGTTTAQPSVSTQATGQVQPAPYELEPPTDGFAANTFPQISPMQPEAIAKDGIAPREAPEPLETPTPDNAAISDVPPRASTETLGFAAAKLIPLHEATPTLDRRPNRGLDHRPEIQPVLNTAHPSSPVENRTDLGRAARPLHSSAGHSTVDGPGIAAGTPVGLPGQPARYPDPLADVARPNQYAHGTPAGNPGAVSRPTETAPSPIRIPDPTANSVANVTVMASDLPAPLPGRQPAQVSPALAEHPVPSPVTAWPPRGDKRAPGPSGAQSTGSDTALPATPRLSGAANNAKTQPTPPSRPDEPTSGDKPANSQTPTSNSYLPTRTQPAVSQPLPAAVVSFAQGKIIGSVGEPVVPAASGEVLFDTSRPLTTGGADPARPELAASRTALGLSVARQIAAVMPAGLVDKPVEIALEPIELGRVRMTISQSDGAISMLVQAERLETLELMRRHADLLDLEFEGLGFSDVSLSFTQSGADTDPGHSDRDEPAANPLIDGVGNTATILAVQLATDDGRMDLRL